MKKSENMEEYFAEQAKGEFQKEIDDILKTIKCQMDLELKMFPKIDLKWDDLKNDMNASAKKIADDEYRITINVYTPWYLKKVLLWDKLNTEFVNVKKGCLVHSFISHILSFIMWHEYYHIAFGHCTIPQYQGEFNERISEDQGSFERQQFETMCDMAAARKFAADIFIIYQEKRCKEVFEWLLAILYIYFHQCERNQKDKISVNDIINEHRTHPFPTIRFDYILDVLKCEMERIGLSYEERMCIDEGAIEKLKSIDCYEGFEIDLSSEQIKNYKRRLMEIDLKKLLKHAKKIYIK